MPSPISFISSISFLSLLVISGCAINAPQSPFRMQLTSPAFAHNQPIPSSYTCDGADMNPPLVISDVPANAKALALIVDDPDAPRGDWVHWLLWNITPETSGISEHTVPTGAAEGTTDFGRTGWGGPCPPSGTHRYVFKLYALDTELNLPSTTRKEELEKAMEGHIVARTDLIGTYTRKNNAQ